MGLTKKSFFKNFFRVLYKDIDGNIKLFKKKDIGGCSAGFDKFYQYYNLKGISKIDTIGRSQAMIVNAKDSYSIEYDLINNDNSFYFCDNPLCLSCRVSWKYNLMSVPSFLILKLISIFKKV